MSPVVREYMVFFCIVGICVAGLFLVLSLTTGCGPVPESKAPEWCMDEARYTRKLLACVDEATTLAASKACRAEVNKTCGISEVVTTRRVVQR